MGHLLLCAYQSVCRISCIAPCCTGVRLGFDGSMDFFYTHTCVQKLDGKSAKYEIPMVYFFDLICAIPRPWIKFKTASPELGRVTRLPAWQMWYRLWLQHYRDIDSRVLSLLSMNLLFGM
jgi:hypothetical protein